MGPSVICFGIALVFIFCEVCVITCYFGEQGQKLKAKFKVMWQRVYCISGKKGFTETPTSASAHLCHERNENK